MNRDRVGPGGGDTVAVEVAELSTASLGSVEQEGCFGWWSGRIRASGARTVVGSSGFLPFVVKVGFALLVSFPSPVVSAVRTYFQSCGRFPACFCGLLLTLSVLLP